MELVKQLLEDRGPELIQSLVGGAGFGAEQARSFLPAAVERVVQALQGGGLDLASLLSGGGAEAIVAKVDTQALAQEAGVEPQQATRGLEALAGPLLGALQSQAGGAGELLSKLGGGKLGGLLGGAGKLGKLFR